MDIFINRQQRRQLTLRDFLQRLFLRENRTGGQDRPAYAEGYGATGQGQDRQSKNLHRILITENSDT